MNEKIEKTKLHWYGGSVMRNGKRIPVVLPEKNTTKEQLGRLSIKPAGMMATGTGGERSGSKASQTPGETQHVRASHSSREIQFDRASHHP